MADIKEWTGIRYEDLMRLAQDRKQGRITTANLLKEDDTCDDDDDDDSVSRRIGFTHQLYTFGTLMRLVTP